MISSGRLFFCLLQCILLLLTNADDGQPIRGVPGIDYPNYQTIPLTSFRCSEHGSGLYADPDTGCQMFHHCYEHRHESFLCPAGTIFNQAILGCDYWYSADCSAATSHFSVKSQHEASNIGIKIESNPIKNPSVNLFNKMASLYEPLSIESDYAFKENLFSDSDNTYKSTSVSGNSQEYNSLLKVSGIQDRREGVVTETYSENSYYQYENKNDNRHGVFEDFESSGEPEDYGEHLYSEEEFSSLKDTENSDDFEKQYFAYDEFKDLEHDAKYPLNNEEHLSNVSDIIDGKESSSKDLKSGDKFVKRQSKAVESRNERKYRRRKPIYTIIEPEANIKEYTTTEMPKYKTNINLNNPTDSPTYSQEPITASNSVSTSSTIKNKRRKPVLIELEETLQYNVNNKKISSISYGNSQSNIPAFSMDAEEISVKLFPSKPVDGLVQHQFIDTNGNVELRALNNIDSHESNIYHQSTLSALGDIESFEDTSMNMNQLYPKRKKNAIRIVDSKDNPDSYIENEEPKYATTFTPIFEDDFATQSTSMNFEDLDEFSEPHFDYHDVEKAHEIADGNSEVVRTLEDNHDLFVKNEIMGDSTTFTPIFEDELATQSTSMNFGDFDKFAEPNFHDHDLENEIEDGHSELVEQEKDNHEVYIENEELKDVTTITPILEDDFTTLSASTDSEDFDKFSEPNFNYHNVEITHEIKNGHLDLYAEQYEDSSYNFITPYPDIEMFDESEDTHFIQMNPDAAMNIEKYKDKRYLEYIDDFEKHKNFEDSEMQDNEEKGDYSYITTEFPIPEISTMISSKNPHSESDTNQFYFNPNNIIESTFESSSNFGSETVDENDDVTNVVKPLSNYNYEGDNGIQISHNEEIKRNLASSEVKLLNANTSQNITNSESEHARTDVDSVMDTDIKEYFINENIEDNLNMDSIKNIHTEASVYFDDNSSSKDSLEGQYHPHDTVPDVDSMETNYFNQRENESNTEAILHKLDLGQNKHSFDEPMDSGILGKMDLESVENKSNETFNSEDSETDFEGLTNILDEFEKDQNLSQTDQTIELEYTANSVQGSKSKAEIVNTSETLTAIEANVLNKEYSNLPHKNHETINPKIKDKPMRIPRMFMPPYTRDFNLERFNRNFNFKGLSSQNFANVPDQMLQLKEKGMNKLSSSIDGYGMKGIENYYSTRTGNLLESPKISKLISIGKNLINAKKAKLRILRRYVNY